MTLLILSHGHEQIEQTQEPLPPLKERVRDVTGETVRRIGRFIQLSLIGAGHCLHGQTAPAETAVYLSSGRGDLEVTLDVLTQMIVDGQPPKPLSFINTVSNSACYYVARHFGQRVRHPPTCPAGKRTDTRRTGPGCLSGADGVGWCCRHLHQPFGGPPKTSGSAC